MRLTNYIGLLPLAMLAVIGGAYLSAPPAEEPTPDLRRNDRLVLDADLALRAAEKRHQARFFEAADPERASAERSKSLQVAVAANDGEALIRLGFDVFVRDRPTGKRRLPAREANRCAACHSRGGPGGAGGLVDDYFEGRNPPALWGAGLLEALAAEITKELREDSRAGRPLEAKGVSYASGLAGDLVIRPFGRGKWATLDEAISAMEPAIGGVLSSDERAALRAWVGSLPAPGLEPPDAGRMPDLFERMEYGLRRFRQIGCASCHVPVMTLQDGTRVEAYTDLRLHDVGTGRLLTPPLWGLAASAPWLHDGSALASLDAAILAHQGEADPAARAYERLELERRGEIKVFLLSLAPAPKLQIAGQ